jgi:hypothetical protein
LSFDFNYQFDRKGKREQEGSVKSQTKFSVVPFYYLKFLTEANPTNIYDLGCGWNIFKKYIPNIIGLDIRVENNVFHADIQDFVDDDYIKDHQNYFESVFSICALHFIPLSNIRQRVLDFGSMIKDGGRGFLTLNYMRMLERETMWNVSIEDHVLLEEQIRNELSALPFNLDVFEVDLSLLNNPMDGNIRMVIRK